MQGEGRMCGGVQVVLGGRAMCSGCGRSAAAVEEVQGECIGEGQGAGGVEEVLGGWVGCWAS